MPLGWLLRPLGKVKEAVAAHLPRTVLIAAAIAGGIAALVLVPADFNVEAPGTMQPVVRRDVFAPRSGIVDEVLVEHGADVKAGEPLVRMRDPALELELKRVDGELETAQRQLDAVRATRTNRASAKRSRSNRIGSRPKSASCSRSSRIRGASWSCSSTSASSLSSPARSPAACSRGTLAISCWRGRSSAAKCW